MSKEIPKKCLTCSFMEFLDDDLDIMLCLAPTVLSIKPGGIEVQDDGVCTLYELNQGIIADAEMGMW